ncbi:MAG: PAS domain-containing protein [Gammaproteobacteria bacterium]|nr:PAS domain-containing protein [Rhodocyclaceae bacterium]MBU3908613.1 PAS domain-containing protein [Gammaproteobacteria bacterium]MBU3990440.1 PAS domain-containing protein [Gammaproteobacteria bacterium]MBU4004641.1 PAS domain-containing protein [Gammaproteobacteria bacterium]MBU4021244.1 PAS domain-containing protein [Gammaproteobacteria bacterium]
MKTKPAAQKTRKPRSPATSAGAAAPAADANAANAATARFPIVGIGASAGGLEAFEQLFQNMPADSGLAFVLVPHLDPGHASILTDILQRSTVMPVVEVADQMVVQPNQVHIIPPNRDMAIFHGTLQLSVPESPRGQRMPIDSFLRSLAEDQGERAIGIILSGTGTDGTLGLRAILGAGGITLVQDPVTAKYDGMPASAIHSGYATHSLPADKMSAVLLSGARGLAEHRVTRVAAAAHPEPAAAGGMKKLLMLLRSATGHDFSLYKQSTIGRRIERRMVQHDLDDIEVYARYLKEHPAEVQALFKELLINVTSFFRDPDAFDVLRQDILPQLFADKPEEYVLRVWVAGCASGEEAYSIAMLLREFMDEQRKAFKVQIYATDLDDDAIAVARAGSYPPNIAADVTPERLRRFFIKEDAGYRVKKDIREMVVFAIQNVIKDPPFTRLDLLACRNLMIYLEPELQNRLIPSFHYALKPGGVLFLSPSESIASHPDLFTPVNRKWKFYRAVHSATATHAVMASDLAWTGSGGSRGFEETVKKVKETDFAELARRTLLQTFAPAAVVTDVKGTILFVHGETGKYLRPAPGQATLNVVDMAREGLQMELRSALHAVVSSHAAVLGQQATLKIDGDIHNVSLAVRPLSEAGQELLLVSFQELPQTAPAKPGRPRSAAGSAAARRNEELERELAYTRNNLQATIEEQQASNEELKSTNEELQSTNEELQSTNEELETSKEELQSVNEELITVNAELQSKIEQLAGMQNDMKNLLDSTNIGTVFLDRRLHIRRFTRDATSIYRLVATDIGRPLADIKSDLQEGDLTRDAQGVLDSLVPREHEVCTTDGNWFLVKILPYRTLDDVIDGVVLTFTNISHLYKAKRAEQAARQLSESIIDTIREPLVVLDAGLRVVSASRMFYRYFRVKPDETIGQPLIELGNQQWDNADLRKLLEDILPHDQSFDDFPIEHDFPRIGRCNLLLNARRIVGATDGAALILLAMEEVKPQKNK